VAKSTVSLAAEREALRLSQKKRIVPDLRIGQLSCVYFKWSFVEKWLKI